MKMKILSPAGEMESLRMAIFNGADEVYLGVKDFNARNIEGFSLETLKEAVDFAHIYNVKVNLTVNILFKDEELQSALDLVADAYNLGVDSFIVQDIGLIKLIHDNYPQVEIHASTQMGIHNLEGVLEMERLGVKRVVLARETPLVEIKRIKENSSVEIEYFCQGALCVSFSGNCYMSSYLHDASGNRGKCKQLCRLPYSFRFNNKEIKDGYLLSAKDFNMLNNLKELEEAGVDVLKIEGRARRPFYVGMATMIYKLALAGQKYDEQDLALAFNRGYTSGYFNGNGDIISLKQNHIGVPVGKVEKCKLGNRFNEIFISSNREISPKSTLKFIVPVKKYIRDSDKLNEADNPEETVITAYDISRSGKWLRITTKQKIEVGAQVNLIIDYQKEQDIKNTTLKREIQVSVVAKPNEKIKAELEIQNEKIMVEGEVCLLARNAPLTKSELETNFSKSEYFQIKLNSEIGNVFLPKQKLNEFRRNVLSKIKEKLIENNFTKIKKKIIKINKNTQKFTDFQYVFNKFDKKLMKNIIYSPEIFELNDILEFRDLCEKENKKPYLNLPIFALKTDIKLLKKIVKETKISVIVNNLYALNFETEKIIGGGLNVFNSCSANYFCRPFISAEGGEFKMPFMTFVHCPMKAHLNANCCECPFKNGYEYVMPNGKRFKLKRTKLSVCSFQLFE